MMTENKQETAIEDLKKFICKERDGRQLKKALAVKLCYQGYRYEDIVKIMDVGLGSISKWVKNYEEDGVNGFKPHHKGRKSYLKKEEEEEIIKWLQSKDIWEISELEGHLAETYGVSYESKQSYYDLMKKAGMSWKKTSKVNPRADEETVTAKKWKSKIYWRATVQK